jgi:hypothetical protein
MGLVRAGSGGERAEAVSGQWRGRCQPWVVVEAGGGGERGMRSEGRRRPRPARGRRLVWLAVRCEDEAMLVGPTSGSYAVGGSRVTAKGRATLSVYHNPKNILGACPCVATGIQLSIRQHTIKNSQLKASHPKNDLKLSAQFDMLIW